MAKVSFTKLGLTKNTNVGSFEWNGQTIEVKAYLPIQEKLELISSVLNQCQDENNFINEAKMSMYMSLEIIYRYTNINFTEKQKSDPAKMYDLLAGSGFLTDVFAVLPATEYRSITTWLASNAKNLYDYRNSIYAILDAMTTDYQSLDLDICSIAQKLSNKENLDMLKDVLTKIGQYAF